jgi:putative ABC transport system permease protein
MAIPFIYNVRSARERWPSSVVAVVGIAGTVAVFVAMLALARGFEAAIVSSGLPENAIVQRGGSDSEMTSVLGLEDVRLVEDAAEVARSAEGPLVSAEVVVVAALPLRETGSDANVQMRGVSERVLGVRRNVRIVKGRFLRRGVYEIVVGAHASQAYRGLDLGSSVRIGPGTWTVVGLFDAEGSAFDSEIWADADVLNVNYQRPPGIYQSITARLRDEASFPAFSAALGRDPRMRVQVLRERDYYASQSRLVTTLITVLGGLVAAVMAIGAVLAALNTMYSAVTERSREIALLRALGFGGAAIITAFLAESLLIAGLGGLIGCVVVLPVNGITTGTLNWQTFSHLAFAFRITPDLLVWGMLFALGMGVAGGLPPAIRAARSSVAKTLRAL